jgi:hypothetical protein
VRKAALLSAAFSADRLRAMNFDPSTLIPGLIFGLIGMAYFKHGKKMVNPVQIGAGLALMIIPYFIDTPVTQISVCVLIAAVPFAMRWF